MRIIVSVQAKGASSRGLVHYLAHSKIDQTKEPEKCREIFNEYADYIAPEKANEYLKNGISNKRPANDELLHLVVSLKPEDYEKLGANEKERQQKLKQLARQTIKTLAEAVGADKLQWAAAIHRNTDNPHVHFAVQKQYFDRNLEPQTLSKIPRELLPHYEKHAGENKSLTAGVLIEETTRKLDEIIGEKNGGANKLIQPPREPQRAHAQVKRANAQHAKPSIETAKNDSPLNHRVEREREILARALLARFYVEKSRAMLDSLENHGDKRRFIIYDAVAGRKRKLSLFDLERRAEKNAARETKKLGANDPAKLNEIRKKLVAAELKKNFDAVERIKRMLGGLINKESKELSKRETEYERIHPVAEKMRQTYRRENRKLPVPALTRDELEMLQAGSLEKKDFRGANYFERVRRELARERNQPTRTDQEVERLKAHIIISELKAKSCEKQSNDLQAGKRHFQVEINGKKWSLAKADAFIEQERRAELKLTSKAKQLLSKVGLTKPINKIEKLAAIKNQIAAKLDEKSENLAAKLHQEKSTLKTLQEFYKNDSNPEKETLAAKFDHSELAEIESLAFELKLADVYRQNWQHQKQFIERASGELSAARQLANDKNKTIVQQPAKTTVEAKETVVAGRAVARDAMCEIAVARAKEELVNFRTHKDFQKFEIVDQKTGEAKFVSLKEVAFDARGSILDQTLEYFLENKEKRETRKQLEKSIKQKELNLKENLTAAQSLLKTAAEDARDYKSKSIFGTISYLAAPIFTPKELVTIELRIKQTGNKNEAVKLQKLLDSVDHEQAKNLRDVLAVFSLQDNRSQATESRTATYTQTTQSIEKEANKTFKTYSDSVNENKVSIKSLNEERNKSNENRAQEKGR